MEGEGRRERRERVGEEGGRVEGREGEGGKESRWRVGDEGGKEG